MTGGILQIAARGTEDLFLIGNAQITFFKTIYRRHTNFSRTEYDLSFESEPNFGHVGKLIIKRYGDLLHRLYLAIKLPKIEARIKSFRIRDIKKYLETINFIWITNHDDNEYFNQDIYDEFIIYMLEQIDIINNEIIGNTNISNMLKDGILSLTNFYNANVDADNDSVDEYLFFILEELIKLDDNYQFIYEFVNAHMKDRINENVDLVNGELLRELLFNEYIDFVTGKEEIILTESYNDENLLFIYNTETAKYNISGSSELVTNGSIFRAGIDSVYNNDNYLIYDAYKIFDKILLQTVYNITNEFDIQTTKKLLLDNEKIGLIKNPKMLKKVYGSLKDDFKFIFYKKFTNNGNDNYTSNEDFVNLSQVSTQEILLQDNWTSDFELEKELNEPNNITHIYSKVVKEQIELFHLNNRNNFRNSILNSYINRIELWSRINVGNPGNPNLDTFSEFCFSEIRNLFGLTITPPDPIPDTFKNMLFLGYIPLLTTNDIPKAIDRYLENRKNNEPALVVAIDYFKNDLISVLNNLRDQLIIEIKPLVCEDDLLLTHNKISDFRTNTGVGGDIIIHAIIKHNIFLEYNNEKLSLIDYIIAVYNDAIINYIPTQNNYTTEYNNEINNILKIINLFATPLIEIPTYTTYINNGYNQTTEFNINTPNNYLSDIISSIWYNLQNTVIENFNDLYDNTILNRDYFLENFGVEMRSYLDTISETYFNSSTPLPGDTATSIDYWYNTDQNSITTIQNYLDNELQVFETQLDIYNNNKNLLNMRLMIIPNNYYFEKFVDLLNYIINEIETKTITITDPNTGATSVRLLYEHQNHLNIQDIVLISQNDFLNDMSKPKNTAMDIFELINNDFQNFINSIVNPYDINIDENKYNLWETYSQVDKSNELTKWNELFAFFTPEGLYNFITKIDTEHNGFGKELDVYDFMLNQIISKSSFNYILKIKGKTVDEYKNNILEYYLEKNNNFELLISNLTGEIGADKILEQLGKNRGKMTKFAWIEKIGHYIINYIDIKIGGQLIDKHHGEWLNIWYELTKKESKKRGYKKLIGDIEELTQFNNKIKDEYEMLIPIKFWFCKNIGLSLPIIALLHSEIEITVKYLDFQDVSYHETLSNLINENNAESNISESDIPLIFRNNIIDYKKKPILKSKMLAEYIFVESDERRKLAQSKLEYLIDRVQYNGDIIISKTILDIPKQLYDKFDNQEILNNELLRLGLDNELLFKTKIYFKNPIKELIWGIQFLTFFNGTKYNNKKYHNYGTDYHTCKGNIIKTAKIQFDTRDREIAKTKEFYNYIEPYEHHNSTPPDGINIYSFSLEPESYQPSGAANFSRIDNGEIILTLENATLLGLEQSRFFIYATSYNILRIFSGMAGLVFFE